MFLGIEIGGTKLQLGLGRGDGKLAALWRGSVDPARGADGIREQIIEAMPLLLEQAKLARDRLKGVGVGFGGPVDDARQAVIKSHQIAGWDDFPLARWISELLGLPAVLGNDADVAGLGEARFGAGKGHAPVFYITIGSGIGGGLIIDGRIYRGAGKGASEIGHLRVCNGAGEHDIIEHLASGWAIQQYARQNADSWLLDAGHGDAESITAENVAYLASRGHQLSRHILDRAWNALAEGICQVIALTCPRRIVIGGGVALMGEKLLFNPLRQKVAERVFQPFADCYEIVPADLGEEVVLHGALALASGA
ncbi:MAG: ROK family protein [Gemmataceae bacterium]